MRFRSLATTSILGAALLLCPSPATGQTSAFISSGTAPLYEVPGQDSLTVPLPLGHDRLETGGFFTALEFVLLQQPRSVMLRTLMMSHLVHHRAQLGVYYRLLGIAVPGVYGPSADE